MIKQPFNAKGRRAQELLELVHTDVCGPIEGKSGSVSHTKHTVEATNMDLFHS